MDNDLIVFLPLALSSLVTMVWSPKWNEGPKSHFQPPGYVFGIVWTIIYILFGVFLNRMRKTKSKYFYPLVLTAVLNLMICTSWPVVVRVYKQNIIGLYMIFMLILTLLCMLCMLENDTQSKLLLVPYLTWCFVAVLLQTEVIRLEKASL